MHLSGSHPSAGVDRGIILGENLLKPCGGQRLRPGHIAQGSDESVQDFQAGLAGFRNNPDIDILGVQELQNFLRDESRLRVRGKCNTFLVAQELLQGRQHCRDSLGLNWVGSGVSGIGPDEDMVHIRPGYQNVVHPTMAMVIESTVHILGVSLDGR